MEDLRQRLTQPSVESKQEASGKVISYLAITLIGGLVALGKELPSLLAITIHCGIF